MRLRIAAVVVAASATLALAWIYVNDGTASLGIEMTHLVAELRRADAALNAEILAARTGFAPNYDALTAAGAKLRDGQVRLATSSNLVTVLGAGSKKDADGVASLLNQARSRVDAKLALVDKIKTERAMVVNSARYLATRFAPQRDDSAPAADSPDLEPIKDAILGTTLAPERTRYIQLKDRTSGTSADETTQLIARHARKLLQAEVLDSYVRDALAIDVSDVATTFESRWNTYQDAKSARMRVSQWTLIALAAALIASIALVLRRLGQMNASAKKFVPYEFLDLLGKGSLADIKRGDAVRLEMSVVFADIRDFTARSEQRSPEENFKFMNDYLGAMETPIHAADGFVNQFLGDGIMALFPKSADDAVAAAVGMRRALEDLNLKNAGDRVEIGIGVNTGKLMLGTFGGRDRMNAGVISDAVNLASRVEGLTKHYGVRLLVSDHTRSLVKAGRFTFRTVDRVRVKGALQAISVHQVVDAESDLAAAQLRTIVERNERAFQHYLAREFKAAAELFKEIAAAVPSDVVAPLLARRCEEFELAPPPAQWDGTMKLAAK
jgi:class 3 adenylate cyclase